MSFRQESMIQFTQYIAFHIVFPFSKHTDRYISMWTLKGLSYSTLTRSLTRWEVGWGVGLGWVSADYTSILTLEPTGTLLVFFFFFFHFLTTQCAVSLGSTSESPWCFIIYLKYKVLHICIIWIMYKQEAKQFNWQKYMISGIIYKHRK